MNVPQRLSFAGFVLLLFIVALAASLRAGYLTIATDSGRGTSALAVQGGSFRDELPRALDLEVQPSDLKQLISNLREHHWYGAKAPLADEEERTGHVAPGYPWLVAQLIQFDSSPEALIRWLQSVLGALT